MEIKEKLAQYKQYKEELSAELRNYVQDKNNPLDERFEALCECPELSEYTRFNNFRISKLNNLLRGKHGTETIEYIYAILTHDASEEDALTPEEEITFKEYCCDNFISSMIFDW
jgi:hypothetical protein